MVHIVLAAFGIEPFKAFIDSYSKHDAGVDHRLVIAFKGFEAQLPDAFLRVAARVDHQAIHVPDRGYDIGTYRVIAELLDTFDHFAFLNSRVRILAEDWLGKLEDARRVGRFAVVGATASAESLFSDHMHIHRDEARRQAGLRAWLRGSMFGTLRHWMEFPPFPNPHLRTNGFLIERSLFLGLKGLRVRSKRDAARFENGRHSLSRQLASRGLDIAVVGHDGNAYSMAQWNRSGTFWQSRQENLLIADNQTDRYETAAPDERRHLFRQAWCDPASPVAMDSLHASD